MLEPVAYSSLWHVFSIFIIYVCGFIFSAYVGKKVGATKKRSFFLFLYHSLWCFVYFWYAGENGADSFQYYYHGLAGEGDFKFGSNAVILIVEFLVRLLGFSYLGVFLFFNIFGTIGYILFDAALRHAIVGSKRWVHFLALIIILLPSVSFWSSALGKDAISFMAVGCALWSAIDLQKRMQLMVFSIAAMLLVRPHMAGLMVMALSLGLFFSPSANLGKKIFLSLFFAAGCMVLIPFALDYAGVKGGANVDSLAEYFEKRESYMKGDSGLDLASMSLPEKLVTYAFRPFIFEARSIFGFAASIDNIIIVFLFGCGVFCAFRYTLDKGYGNKVFMTSYFFMAWFVLAMSTPNLGIALRQKWMFVPFFMYVAFSYINKRQVTVR